MKKINKYHQVINQIEKTRGKNNKNWMDILRLAFDHSPKEASKILKEIYKEEIAKKVPEYSYKTISKIIDDGHAKGIYIALEPDGETGTDAKIKNIRPSEELMVEFLNWSINIFDLLNNTVKENKT